MMKNEKTLHGYRPIAFDEIIAREPSKYQPISLREMFCDDRHKEMLVKEFLEIPNKHNRVL